MTRFRDRMDADMEIRGFSPHTRRAYLRAMCDWVRHFMRPPDRLTPEDIRRYQIHLTRGREVSPGTFHQIVAGIRFFYRVTLRRTWVLDRVPYQKKPRTLPEILSAEKVRALLSALPNLKHHAILMTVYSAALRASEVVRLKLTDVDSERGTLRIEQGHAVRQGRATPRGRLFLPAPLSKELVQSEHHGSISKKGARCFYRGVFALGQAVSGVGGVSDSFILSMQ